MGLGREFSRPGFSVEKEKTIMRIMRTADILLPCVEDPMAWSVIACDQFTSQPDY